MKRIQKYRIFAKFCRKMRDFLTNMFWNIEVWAVQKHVNLVDLVKGFPTNIYLQNLASIQPRTSPVKFAHLAEKSGKGSISNLSTKVNSRTTCAAAAASVNARAVASHLASSGAIREGPSLPHVHSFSPSLERLVLFCIDAKFCK